VPVVLVCVVLVVVVVAVLVVAEVPVVLVCVEVVVPHHGWDGSRNCAPHSLHFIRVAVVLLRVVCVSLPV
jgi:hypothetical protein